MKAKRTLFRAAALAWLVVLLPALAFANGYGPCPNDNYFHYPSYFYSGGGCTVGDKVFSDFGYYGSFSGGTSNFDEWNTLVTPLNTPDAPGFQFESTVAWFGYDAGGGSPYGMIGIPFTVTVSPGGNPITMACLTMSNATFTAPSSIETQFWVGANVGTLTDNGTTCVDVASMGPINVTIGMTIKGPDVSYGVTGQSSGILEFHFYETPVPEPASLLLLGVGLAAMGGISLRQTR